MKNYQAYQGVVFVKMANPQPNTTIVGGAAGWQHDAWDLSSSIITGATAIEVMVVPAAAQNIGVREHNGIVDSHYGMAVPGIGIFNIGVDMHCDLYRDAANTQYILLGYFRK